MSYLIYILTILALVVGLYVYMPEANLGTGEMVGLIIGVVFAIWIGRSVVGNGRMTASEGVKNMLIWGVIFLGIIGVYAYKNDITNSKIFAALKPNSGVVNEEEQAVTYYKSSDGHFHVTIRINNRDIDFLVDTGATGIVLSKEDAKKIGIDMDNVVFNQIVNTANGQTRSANVQVKQFVFNGIDYGNIYVSVNEGELFGSLLGMKFLNMTNGFSIKGNELKIYF